MSDAAAVTAAAARISASPTRAAASIAFVAASVSSPARVGWTRTVPSILILARARPDVSAYAKSLTSPVTPPRVTFAGRRTPRISVDDDAVDTATSTSSPRGPRATYPTVYLMADAPPHPSTATTNSVSSAVPADGVANTRPGVGGPTTSIGPVLADPTAATPSRAATSVKT